MQIKIDNVLSDAIEQIIDPQYKRSGAYPHRDNL